MIDPNQSIQETEIDPLFNAIEDVFFILYTQLNPTIPQSIRIHDSQGLAATNFNPIHPTRIIIHGWNNHGNSNVNIATRNALLAIGWFNVIVVDWGLGANTNNYVTARNRVPDVGVRVALLIEFLSTTGLNRNIITLIGHSLGAHICGMTGKYLIGPPVSTIIGLDPAGPLFTLARPNERLNTGDALYVETIFTNAGTLGFDSPLGDASFYPNGGRSQPGCGVDVAGNCAHSRAVHYFVESITTNRGFRSVPCHHNEIGNGACSRPGPNVLMGGDPSNIDQNVLGVYFLRTANSAPFALG